MKTQSIIIPAIVVLLLLGAAFYGGYKFSAKKNVLGNANLAENFRNLTPEQQQQRVQQFGQQAGGQGRFGSGEGGVNLVSGEVLSKDANSITVKDRNGSSKIVFFSGDSQVTKSVDGSMDDIQVGTNVIVNGTANQDGSVNAQNIQLRPTTSPITPPTINSN